MPELKEREAYYCNLKLFLLFFVVLGHWIEPYTGLSPWVHSVYRVIYTVHMPLFVFLSGTFLTSPERAKNQAVDALSCYLAAQTIVILTGRLLGFSFRLSVPYWHLWYLLSLSLWSWALWMLERWGRLSGRPLWVRAGAVLLAVGIGCGAGCLPWVGRGLSLSRTLVFFPYALVGRLCPRDILRGKRLLGLAALLGFGILYCRLGSAIPTGFLYQAAPYGGLGPAVGVRLRLICYLMVALFGIGLLALVPERPFFLSRMGADTLGIYLFHVPLVVLFRFLSAAEMVLIGPAASLWIICLLDRLFQWRSQLYTVYQTARRVKTL